MAEEYATVLSNAQITRAGEDDAMSPCGLHDEDRASLGALGPLDTPETSLRGKSIGSHTLHRGQPEQTHPVVQDLSPTLVQRHSCVHHLLLAPFDL